MYANTGIKKTNVWKNTEFRKDYHNKMSPQIRY